MQRHPDITRRRLKAFAQDTNLAGKLYAEHQPVALAIYSAPGRIAHAEAVGQTFTPCNVGHTLGPMWSTHWFKVDIHVPANWAGREVHLLWDSSSEACIWRDGVPVQGLSGSVNDKPPVCIHYPLFRKSAGGENPDLAHRGSVQRFVRRRQTPRLKSAVTRRDRRVRP